MCWWRAPRRGSRRRVACGSTGEEDASAQGQKDLNREAAQGTSASELPESVLSKIAGLAGVRSLRRGGRPAGRQGAQAAHPGDPKRGEAAKLGGPCLTGHEISNKRGRFPSGRPGARPLDRGPQRGPGRGQARAVFSALALTPSLLRSPRGPAQEWPQVQPVKPQGDGEDHVRRVADQVVGTKTFSIC